MKSVYVILTRWFSSQNGVMVPVSANKNDVVLFSTKKRAMRYLLHCASSHVDKEREIEITNRETGEFKVSFTRGGISFQKEYLLSNCILNFFDYE